MNISEVREIRRRLKADSNAVYSIYGCYVNSNKEIISAFEATPGIMGAEEEGMYFGLLKKVLSGSLEKNMMDIEFSVEQVENSKEHQLLMDIKNSSAGSEKAKEEICKKIIETYDPDDRNYLILIAQDAYDVEYKDKNDEIVFDGSSAVFNYFICAVCPVKDPKPALKYDRGNGRFGSSNTGQVASNPEAGFMFPCFNERSADIYHALFYARDAKDMHEDMIDALFKSEPPVSAPQQKVIFSDALETAVEKELSFDVIQAVNEKLRETIKVHKEAKNPETLAMSITETVKVLSESGISEEKASAFAKICEDKMGEDAVIRPQNVIDENKFEVRTPEVQIKVDPDASFVIETRVIDGRKYILIPADTGIEVNGVEVNIPLEEK